MIKINKYIKIITFNLLFILLLISKPISADMGPKPSIDININNPYNYNLEIDLLFYSENADFDIDKPITDRKINDILKEKNFDNYISAYLYYNIPFELTKKSNYNYHIGYLFPKEFKLAIYDLDNNILYISNLIERKRFEAKMDVDINYISNDTNELFINYDNAYIKEVNNYFISILKFLSRIIITIIVELFILFLFKFKDKFSFKVVLLNNLFTQIILNIILYINYYNYGLMSYYIFLIIGEIIVLIFESLINSYFIKEKKKYYTIIYTIIANIVTFLLTFLIY